MSIPAVLPEPTLAYMDVEEPSRQGTKRPRDGLEDDDSSVSSFQGLSEDYVKHRLTLVAPIPKRPRSSPSNQIHEAIFACPVPGCCTNYTRRSNLKNHLITKHAELHPRKTFSDVFRRKPKCKPGQRQSPPLLNKATKCTHEGCGKSFANDRALASHVTEAHEDVMGAILGMLSMKASDFSSLPPHAHEMLLPMDITPTYEEGLIDAMPKPRTPELPRSRSPTSMPSTPSPPLPSFQSILTPQMPFVAVNANSTPSTASARFLSAFSTPDVISIPVYPSAPQQVPPNLGAPVFFPNYPANDFLRNSQFGNQPQTSGFPSVSDSTKI